MKKVGLDEFVDVVLHGSDEELMSCEVREEEKISCKDMVAACKVIALAGIASKEMVERLSLLPGRRV